MGGLTCQEGPQQKEGQRRAGHGRSREAGGSPLFCGRAVLQVLRDLPTREAAGPRQGMQIISPPTAGEGGAVSPTSASGRHGPPESRSGKPTGAVRAGGCFPPRSHAYGHVHRPHTCGSRVTHTHTHTHTSLQPVPRPNFRTSPSPWKAPSSASLTWSSPPHHCYKAPAVSPLWHFRDTADKRPLPNGSKDKKPWTNGW